MQKRYTILLFAFVFVLLGSALQLAAQTTVPQWRPHTVLPVALSGHATVLLHNGDILVAGGVGSGGQTSAASFIYSAATGLFTPTINTLAESRAYHSLVVVPGTGGSRVFAIGGYTGTAGNYRSLASVEVLEFDIGLNNWRWRNAGAISEARGGCAAVWDKQNFIVVSGGRVQTTGALHSGVPTAKSDRINIQTLQITAVGNMQTARAEHTLVRTLDANDKPQLVTAGGEQTRPTTSTELLPINTTVWDPLANPPVVYRSRAASVGDISGIARVFGGFSDATMPLNTCEWYDVKSGWRAAPRMQVARARANATLVAGPADTARAYLIVAGQGTSGAVPETEVFTLPTNAAPNGQWVPFPSLNRRGAERTATVAGSNLPLVTGGDDGSVMSHTEIFQPLRANDLAFGQEEVGRKSDSLPVVIRNEWLLPVEVRSFRFAGGAEFILSGDVAARRIQPGGQRTVFVSFRPNAAGERTDLLLFDVGPLTDTVKLRGSGIESEIAVVTGKMSFDSVFINTTERRCFTAIRNRGTDTTVIDSVIVTPRDVYRVVSPIGRVAVPPGDSLVVCVEFSPLQRGSSIASLTVHIANRVFPLGISGMGIRRFAVASSMAECDTLTIAPGDSTTRFVTIFNPGDKPVTITAAKFTAGVDGLFSLADPTVLPLEIAPGATALVEIAFKPQREATERATVQFVNNGDTATRSEMCFVLRSRFIAPSVGSLDLGTLCVGDSAAASFLLENPGQFESIAVDNVTLQSGSAFVVTSAIDTTLRPREYMAVRVHVVPATPGVSVDTVIATGSFGTIAVPVRVRAVPTFAFVPKPPDAEPGATIILPLDLEGDAASQIQQASLVVGYNKTMLYPRRIVQTAGAPAIDFAQSTMTPIRPGAVQVSLVWQAPVAGNTPAFGIECEVLRGDNDRADIMVNGAGTDDFCIASAKAVMPITGPCGGQGGFIRTDGVSFIRALPNPAVESVQLLVRAARAGRLIVQIVNTLGEPVAVHDLGVYSEGSVQAELDVSHLPAGAYFARAILDAEIVDVQPVMLMR